MNELVIFGRALPRRRAERVIAALIAVVSVWSVLVASRALGPSLAELGRLSAIERAEQLVLKLAGHGMSSLSALELRALAPDAGAPPALALLFAPQTGVETRRFLGEKAREGQGKAKEALDRGREAFQKAMEGESV